MLTQQRLKEVSWLRALALPQSGQPLTATRLIRNLGVAYTAFNICGAAKGDYGREVMP